MMSAVSDLARFLALSFTSPRASLRQVLDAGHGFDVVLLFLVLGYLIEAILARLLIGSSIQGSGGAIPYHVLNIIVTAVGFFLLSGVIYWAGRAMGGTATLAQAQIATAWFMLVTSLITPIALASLPDGMRNPPSDPNTPIDMTGANPTAIFIVAGIVMWLLSSTIAEAHGFRSVWRVAGVILGIMLGAMILVSSLAAA